MSEVIFKIMGGFVIFYVVGVLFVGLFVPRFSSAHQSLTGILGLLAFVAPAAAVGIGLFYLRKWAALGLSLFALYPAFWCLWGAIHPTPGNADWLGFVFALLLIIPSILTARYWHILVWRKKSDKRAAKL